jgi:hypothetical protein
MTSMKLNKALALAGGLLLLLSLVTLATLQITVKTPYPIYINGTLYLPGTYTFNSPVVIWMPPVLQRINLPSPLLLLPSNAS